MKQILVRRRMRHVFIRSAFLVAAGLLLHVSPVAASIDPEAEKYADEGAWQNIYQMYAGRDLQSLDGLQKYVFLAAARLSNHNQVAYELRGQLTAADSVDVDHRMPSSDELYMDVGEAVLYAMVMELEGDLNEASKYAELGYAIFNRKAEEGIEHLERWEVSERLRIASELQSVYALVQTRMNLERRSGLGLSAAYEQFGKEIQLVQEIEASAKALGVDLDSLLAGTSTMKDTLTADTNRNMSHQPPGEEKSPGQLSRARVCDSLFEFRQTVSTSYAKYYCGNNLVFLGQDSAAGPWYRDIALEEPECPRFWKPYLERDQKPKSLEYTIELLKDEAEKDESDTNVWLFMSDCFRALGKPKKAVEEISKHLKKTSPTSVALSTRGRAYVDLKDYANAEADASAAIALDSTNFEAWYVLGHSDQANGGAKAKGYFQKAYELAPRELHLRMHAKAMAE